MDVLTREMERVLNLADELEMMMEFPEEIQRALDFPDDMERMLRPPARSYVKSAKAFLRTPADIYEHPDSYSFVIDMPGLDPDMIKVKVEDGKVLHVVGKRRKKQAGAAVEKKAEGETKVEGAEEGKAEAVEGKAEGMMAEAAEKKAEAGEGKEAALAPAAKPIRIERRRARYTRRFNLPEDADGENVKATYRNGVLTVVVGKLPVKEEPPKPTSIRIPVS